MTFIIQSTPYRVFSIISQATGCMLQHGSRSVSSGQATCLGCYLPGELPAWVLPACCTTCLPNQTRSNKTVLTQKPDLQSTRNRKTPNFIFLIFFWFFFNFFFFFSENLQKYRILKQLLWHSDLSLEFFILVL